MKYIQPKSLTWWAGFVPVVLGVILAVVPEFPRFVWLAHIIDNVTGGLPAAVLINAGLALIGLKATQVENRDAIKKLGEG